MDIVGGHFIEEKKEGRMKGGREGGKRADGEREEREGGRQTR